MSNNTKLLVIYSEKSFVQIEKLLHKLNFHFKITPYIINDYQNYNGDNVPLNEIEMCYKNNTLVFYRESRNRFNIFTTKDNLDKNDILYLTYEEFNNVSGSVLVEYDFFVCLVDSIKHSNKDLIESEYTFERINVDCYYIISDDNIQEICDNITKDYNDYKTKDNDE